MRTFTEFFNVHTDTPNDTDQIEKENRILQQTIQWHHASWFNHDMIAFIDQLHCRNDLLVAKKEEV